MGAVLSHQMEDETEQPIGFASRTLAPAERKYAQVEKEALAIIFGVKKFHQYLLRRRFTILSDHKPLMHLLSEVKGVPPLASARIQCWARTLSAYMSMQSGIDLERTWQMQTHSVGFPWQKPPKQFQCYFSSDWKPPWSRRPRFRCGQDETQCWPRSDDTYYMAGHNQWTTQTVE